MTIKWTKPAIKDLKKIFNYYKRKVSQQKAKKIINSILDDTQILKTQNIGRIEDLLQHLNQEHRYLVSSNYKIIYIIRKDIVYITHAFDTRQNPQKIK